MSVKMLRRLSMAPVAVVAGVFVFAAAIGRPGDELVSYGIVLALLAVSTGLGLWRTRA
jgi:hypothetical protein